MKLIAARGASSLVRVLLCTIAPLTMFKTASIANAQDALEEDNSLEVVVTASRTEEAISSIPGTVQVISGEQLQDAIAANGDLSSALARLVPGYSLDNQTLSDGGQSFRGRAAQVLVNGTPRTTELRRLSRALSLIDPESIERIEIVNGASAIYGGGATGGIINIITKTAEKEGFSGEVSTTVSASERDIQDSADITTSVAAAYLNEGTSIQLNGQFKNTGDRFDGSGDMLPEDPLTGQGGGSGIEQYNISGQATIEGEAVDLSIYANLVKMEQDIKYNTIYGSDSYPQPYNVAGSDNVVVAKDSPYLGLPPEEDSKNIGAKLNFYELGLLGDGQLEVYYNDAEKRAALVPFSLINPVSYFPNANESQTVLHAKQVGVRTTINTDLSDIHEGLELTWGADYSYNDISQTLPDGRDIISPMRQHGYAAFAQLATPVTDMFEVRGGLRYERFFLDIDGFIRPNALAANPLYRVLPGEDQTLILGQHTFTEASEVYSATVFNLGGVMHVTDELDLFAGFSQGFSVPDVGSFTRRAMPTGARSSDDLRADGVVDVSRVAPEAMIVNNYEVGVRYNTADLTVAALAFLSTSDQGINFDDATQTVLQAEERIWGAELTARKQVNTAWGIGAMLAYQEGIWDPDNDGDLDEDLPNNRIQSPFKAVLSTDYNFGNGLALQGEAVFSSGRYGKQSASRSGRVSDLAKLKSTYTFNANASYASDYGDFRFGVTNILDAKQENTTATALRDNVVQAEGRRFFLQYSKTF